MSESTETHHGVQESQEPRKEFVEIEVPERLERGQNFYDQEPLSSEVLKIAEGAGKDIGTVRSAFSRMAQAHYSQFGYDNKFAALELLNSMRLRDLNMLKLGSKGPKDIAEVLDKYPHLSEYINHQLEWKSHRMNGDDSMGYYRGQENFPTYAYWVTEKLQAKKRLISLGIEEIFPQNANNPEIAQLNLSGAKPVNRRYRILKAAEIIRT